MIPTYSDEIRAQEKTPSERIKADVIIVGAGVVGGLMAWRLSQQGLNVAILEAGAEVDRVNAIERYKNDLQKDANSPYEMMPWAPIPEDSDPLSYYVQPKLPKDK
ncbi:FAD-dependent oxidoreductase, partial [Oceanospirillum sp. HFRX-1_2]